MSDVNTAASPKTPSPKHSLEAFGLTILKSQHKDIRRLKREGDDASLHGNKVWKSAQLLIDYLREFPPEPGCRILELGCGWGLSGIYCAKHHACEVVGLDADDSVFPYTELHAELNGVEVGLFQGRFEDITVEDLEGFDMVIGADICFWDELTPVIQALVERALEAEVPRIVLADPGRPPFREMAEYIDAQYADQIAQLDYTDWTIPEPHNVWGLILDLDTQAKDVTRDPESPPVSSHTV